MYSFTARLAAFGRLSTAEATRAVESFVDGLMYTNIGYLRDHPRTPLIYESGVYYCRDERGKERQWWDIPEVLKNGCADCKALAAWRAAELVVRFGIAAEPVVSTHDGQLFHVMVRTANAVEDPSALLGMHGA